MLTSIKNIRAIYACSTRSTISACEAVKTLGLEKEIRLIGSDLFDESVRLLRSGNISAIIHNRPYSLAQFSIQALANYLADDQKETVDTIWINSDIVMKGNVDFYLRDIPALSKYAEPEAAGR
jgi:ABC-type sugar transport system substrate-binding protein